MIERLVHVSEFAVVAATELIMVASILVATGVIYVLLIGHLPTSVASVSSIEELQVEVERVFAGVLLLLLGLELLKGLSSFFVGYRVQVEIIVVVALIAVARHIMLVDFDHVPALELLGIAALVLALALSYALVRQRGSESADDRTPPGE
jgi:uncharacterized membrane protein (DUF373 family)